MKLYTATTAIVIQEELASPIDLSAIEVELENGMTAADPIIKEYFWQGGTVISTILGVILPGGVLGGSLMMLFLAPIIWIALFWLMIPVTLLCIGYFVAIIVVVDPVIK